MECLRVKLYAPIGVFKTPLSIKGIETYPLPSYSTVIGLIYSAMGRKWNGEYFQVSIQGDYQGMFRDYIWFKKFNLADKKLETCPLQVPILYDLRLLIHIKANEEFLREIEDGLREPRELLFLSGGEYPVKVEEVKKVKYYERFISKDDSFLLKYNVYIPRELEEGLSFSKTEEGSERGILYTLPYFYRGFEKPRVFSYVDVYYFLKGTQVYGSLILDEDGNAIFWANPQVEEIRKKEVEEEYIKFYAGNWLTAAACVGVLKVLEDMGEDVGEYVEGRTLNVPRFLWGKLPKFYVDYLLKDKTRAKEALKSESRRKGEEINTYIVLIGRKLSDFHHDSVFTNASSKHIKRLKGFYSENFEEVLEKVKESFLDAYKELLNKTKELSGTCFFCYERRAQDYVDATTFTPLFASLKTANNFTWDPMFICKECEFLLYFASIGFYRSAKRKYLFVYFPDDLLKTYRLNLILSTKEKIEQEKLGKMWSVVRHVLELEKEKSDWILQNIYFIEIEMARETTANIYSFHINPNLAEAIRRLIEHYPKNFQDIFSEFLFYVYTGRSLYEFLFLLLSGYFYKDSYKNLDAKTIDARIVMAGRDMEFLSSSLLFFINFQEVMNMNGGLTMEKQKNYIKWAFGAGRTLKRFYNESERTQRKLETLTYRLLEAVRRKDKEYFIHNLIRAYLEVEKEIPSFFKEALEDKNFSMIAYAFLIGLNSEEKTKAEEAIEETTSEGEITESA